MSYFVHGGKLSYLDYLQAKSFETSFRTYISARTRGIIASNEDLAEANIKVTAGLQGGIDFQFR